jgi:hypothetical protein
VEFDTHQVPAINDPTSNHVGINLRGDPAHGAGSPFTAHVAPNFDDGNPWYAWIDYNGTVLEVRANQSGIRPVEPLVSRPVSLASILGSEPAYVGFSAGTGAEWGRHEIVSWRFANSLALSPRSAALTGVYVQDFNSLAQRIVMPEGFSAWGLPGNNFTYIAARPITAASVATATLGGEGLTVWNVADETAGFRAESSVANAGSSAGSANRSLATGPATTAASIIQLVLTNSTGNALQSIDVGYEAIVHMLGGNPPSRTEVDELPGYTFFYSTDGTQWHAAADLDSALSTVGAERIEGSIRFDTPVLPNAPIYFRWVDDNHTISTPDVTYAIDNIRVQAVPVPEPAAIQLMTVGLGAFLFCGFRSPCRRTGIAARRKRSY